MLTESLDIIEYMNGEQRPGRFFAHVQGDLSLRKTCAFCACLKALFHLMRPIQYKDSLFAFVFSQKVLTLVLLNPGYVLPLKSV